MRAITDISIRVEENKTATMFLTYNNDVTDYSFSNHYSIEDALNTLPKNNPYFPIRTREYSVREYREQEGIFTEPLYFQL